MVSQLKDFHKGLSFQGVQQQGREQVRRELSTLGMAVRKNVGKRGVRRRRVSGWGWRLFAYP